MTAPFEARSLWCSFRIDDGGVTLRRVRSTRQWTFDQIAAVGWGERLGLIDLLLTSPAAVLSASHCLALCLPHDPVPTTVPCVPMEGSVAAVLGDWANRFVVAPSNEMVGMWWSRQKDAYPPPFER
jgi:hypothetical protein